MTAEVSKVAPAASDSSRTSVRHVAARYLQNSIATQRVQNQDLGQLVRVSWTHCCACTARLSTWWSSTALTHSKWWGASSRGGLPA